MKLAVVGVTGLVGNVVLEVLQERNFPVSTFIPVASSRSVGTQVTFRGVEYPVVSMEDAIAAKPDIAIFSAGGDTSLLWAPKFAEVGTIVVDNSSAWRMNPDHKLIVPEINADSLTPNDRIIANPNCSTIQMVVALAPLHKKLKINRIVISTYQSITGTGMKAVKQYQLEKKGFVPKPEEMAYHYPIFENCIPQCDVFLENGYTKEEMKLVLETKKIMRDDTIKVTATAVRVPVLGGHSESVNVSFERDFDLAEVRQWLADAPGVFLSDDPAAFQYPMPLWSKGKDSVFVGRLRIDDSAPNTLNMWITADNLRKGAATNAIQIAEYLVENSLV
ncbi:MAG: aspartate-semialdehyde dehydrogenase [Saprospiraceae bacterium]|nr:aspartate-semialdehyde dehydrogenase [Saprospiraceae bacterium]